MPCLGYFRGRNAILYENHGIGGCVRRIIRSIYFYRRYRRKNFVWNAKKLILKNFEKF